MIMKESVCNRLLFYLSYLNQERSNYIHILSHSRYSCKRVDISSDCNLFSSATNWSVIPDRQYSQFIWRVYLTSSKPWWVSVSYELELILQTISIWVQNKIVIFIFSYHYTFTGDRWWRKNRRRNGGLMSFLDILDQCIGVDLNRNFGHR